jgi:hypothetical protein
MLVFVDADTLVNEAVLTGAVKAVRDGAVGGSCLVLFEGALPLYARLLIPLSHGAAWLLRRPEQKSLWGLLTARRLLVTAIRLRSSV